jgi:hypothetical protein
MLKFLQISFVLLIALAVLVGIDYIRYQSVHQGLWDSGFSNYLHDRLGIPHIL